MAMRIGGFRRKTRSKLQKGLKSKGKISIRKYLQELDIGERVQLTAEPAVQKGMYFPRFHGKVGIVQGKKGNCYEIKITDLGKDKVLIVHPLHLKKLND